MSDNIKRYKYLQNNNAPCADADSVSCELWNGYGHGHTLVGDELSKFIDEILFKGVIQSDEQRYLALRNRSKREQQYIALRNHSKRVKTFSVTFWKYNPDDNVNEGVDVVGEEMDKIIDKMIEHQENSVV